MGRVSRPLTSFQRLALWTTATTYLLILVGGLVRASGAGLGCPDWPRCFGSWIPPASAAALPAGFDPSQFNPSLMWTEYLNRLLGVSVGFLILATLVSAIRHHRGAGRILWPTLAAFLLVGFQGWLGGVVVQQELASWIVTVHLVVALVIVSLLLYATVYAFFLDAPPPAAATRARRTPLTWAVIALIVLLSSAWIGLDFANRLVAPIRRLIGAANVVSTGNLNVRVPIRRSEGDLAQLGETFNNMTQELRTQHEDIVRARDVIDSRRRFTEAVLAAASAGVIGVNAEGHITILNRSAERLLARSEREGRMVMYTLTATGRALLHAVTAREVTT